MPSLQMVYDIIARDNASAAFGRAGTAAEGAGKKINGLVKTIAGFAVADLGYHVVKMAGDFEQLTNVLVTAAGESQKNLPKVRDGILNIATSTGTAWKEVAAATYIAEKANLRGADALTVVKAAAQGAREENAKLSTVTNAVTSVMASYGLKASDAVAVTNEIKTAAGESKTTMEEFSNSLSTVLPFASAAHISFADVAGVLATLTQHGTTAAESTQEIANTVRNLVGPLGTARKEMGQFNIDSVDVQKNLGSDKRGLTGTIQYLSDTILQHMGPAGTALLNTFNVSKQASQAAGIEFKGLGPEAKKLAQSFMDNAISIGAYRKQARALPGEQGALAWQFLTTYTNAKGFQDVLKQGGPLAQTYSQALKVMLGGTNGLNTALQILGPNLGVTKERSDKVAGSFKNAGKDVAGWGVTSHNLNTQLAQVGQQAEALSIKIGMAVLPVLKDVLGVLLKHPAILQATAVAVGVLATAWAGLKIAGLIKDIAGAAAGLLGLGRASTVAAAEMNASTGIAGAAEKSFLGVTGIGTAVSRLAGGAALAVVGKMLFDWAQSAGNARRQIDAVVNAKITNPYDPSQLNAAAAGIDGLVQKASKHNSSLGSLITGAFSGSDFTNSALIDQGEKKYAALRATAVNLGIAISELHNRFGLTNDDLTSLAAKSNIKFGTDVKGLVQGEDAFKKIYAAELDALPVNQKFASGLKDTAGAASDTGNKIDALSGIVGGLISKQAGSLQATDGYHKALNDLGSSLDSNSKTLLGNADAAINNRAAMVNLVEQSAAAATAYAKGTGKADDYTKALQFAIPEIEAAATAQGVSKQEIDGIITGLGLMPDSKTVPFSSPGLTESLTALAEYNRQLALVPQSIITQVTQMYGSAGPTSVNDPRISGHKAAGGFITGPGSGTSDSILTWLSNGEYVMPAHVVKQMGVGFFDQLRGVKTPGFAAGGLVGANSPETSYLQSLNVAAYLKTIAAATVAMTAKLTTFVQNQQQFRDSLKSTVTTGSTISDLLAQSGNPGDLKRLFAGKIGDIRAFAGKITALKKQGWPDAIIREIAGDGINIGSNYADLLLSASKSDRSSLIGSAGTLGGAQLGTANLITLMTGGTAGLTKMPAIAALNKAIFNPGASQGTLIGKAAAAQTSPLIHIDHVSSTVDLQLIAKQAAFLQSAGHFG
jgi:hypothetical protein